MCRVVDTGAGRGARGCDAGVFVRINSLIGFKTVIYTKYWFNSHLFPVHIKDRKVSLSPLSPSRRRCCGCCWWRPAGSCHTCWCCPAGSCCLCNRVKRTHLNSVYEYLWHWLRFKSRGDCSLLWWTRLTLGDMSSLGTASTSWRCRCGWLPGRPCRCTPRWWARCRHPRSQSCLGIITFNRQLSSSAVNRSIGFATGFHNHGEGPY